MTVHVKWDLSIWGLGMLEGEHRYEGVNSTWAKFSLKVIWIHRSMGLSVLREKSCPKIGSLLNHDMMGNGYKP